MHGLNTKRARPAGSTPGRPWISTSLGDEAILSAMLELRRLLDSGYDVTFQHGDGTAAESTGGAATPATVAGGGRAVVPAARTAASPSPVPGSPTASRGTFGHLSPQVAAAKRGGDRATCGLPHQACATLGGASARPVGRLPVLGPAGGRRDPVPDHQAPVPNHLGGAGSEPSVEAYVDELDGAERKVLLNHIAQAWPEVVEAGVELVAQWRAECAERRHAADKRKAKERRRRQRADARRAELGG
jgi:hypothetical protein